VSAFREAYGLDEGESLVVLGAPGTGKSHLLGSVCEVVAPERVALLCTKPKELMSHLYRKYGLNKTPHFYHDAHWRPERGEYEAKAWLRLLNDIDDLYVNPDIDAVLLDVGTDAINLLDHHLLAPHSVASPGDLANTMGYYRQLKDGAQALSERLVGLTLPQLTNGAPKFVLVAWHTQPAKDDMAPTKQEKAAGVLSKPSADKRASGVEYWGEQLPMIEGGYRRKLIGDYSIKVISQLLPPAFDPATKKMTKGGYGIRVRGSEKHQVAIGGLSADDLPEFLPNEFSEILKRLREV
jgi:energy-coupling factor transporter ATP-binding protein EcfA2